MKAGTRLTVRNNRLTDFASEVGHTHARGTNGTPSGSWFFTEAAILTGQRVAVEKDVTESARVSRRTHTRVRRGRRRDACGTIQAGVRHTRVCLRVTHITGVIGGANTYKCVVGTSLNNK